MRIIDADALLAEFDRREAEPEYQHEGEDWYCGLISGEELVMKAPIIEPDRSLWFRIGEICVDESKGHLSAERAVEKIRELLREGECAGMNDSISRQIATDVRRYAFGNDEFSLEAAYHDCKLVFDGITDGDSFQEADTGLILYYANEIIYALQEALEQPERKRGKWLSFCRGKICNCSVCYKGYDNKDGFIEEWNYCPNCGAKMERW